MNLAELIAKWKEGMQPGDMVRIRKSVLKNIRLPDDAKEFLNKGGLLDEAYSGTLTPTLPPLPQTSPDTAHYPPSFARYRVLGEVGFRMFECLDEEEDGRVVIVRTSPEGKIEVIFGHSSILHYAECSMKLGEEYGKFEAELERARPLGSKEAWDRYVERFEQVLREIDPATLEEELSWKAQRLARLKAGNPF